MGRRSSPMISVTGAWLASVARAALPDADHVSRWVAECGHPQISLRVGRFHHRSPGGGNSRDRVVDAVHVDVWTHTGFASDGCVGHEVADNVTGAVFEARVRPILGHGPSEHALVEGSGLLRIPGG